jgi:hypothetical protein
LKLPKTTLVLMINRLSLGKLPLSHNAEEL